MCCIPGVCGVVCPLLRSPVTLKTLRNGSDKKKSESYSPGTPSKICMNIRSSENYISQKKIVTPHSAVDTKTRQNISKHIEDLKNTVKVISPN